jgi:hypothetical protein
MSRQDEARCFAQVCLGAEYGAGATPGKLLDDATTTGRYVFAVETTTCEPTIVVVERRSGYWRCWEVLRPGAPSNELYPPMSQG